MKAPKLLIVLGVSCVLLAFGSCSANESVRSTQNDSTQIPDTPEESPITGQRILFEVTYINFAWGFQFHGFYIDTAGNVGKFRYESDDNPWQASDPDNLTEDDLMEKYSHNSALETTLDKTVVDHMMTFVSGAAAGELSDRQSIGNDMGSISYTVYLFDDDRETYHSVTLLIYGDWKTENYSSEADTLVGWLKSIPINWQH